MSKPKFNLPFYGCVYFKDWFQHSDGKNYVGVVGEISVYENKDVVGFDASNKEANWHVRVAGKNDFMVFFGCQIKGASSMVPTDLASAFLKVT